MAEEKEVKKTPVKEVKKESKPSILKSRVNYEVTLKLKDTRKSKRAGRLQNLNVIIPPRGIIKLDLSKLDGKLPKEIHVLKP